MQYGANVNVVAVGNSLMAGFNGSSPIAPSADNWLNVYLRPLLGPGARPIVNLGVGGNGWAPMASSGQLDTLQAAWQPGMINVLVCLEDTNTCCGVVSGAACAELARQFTVAAESRRHWDYKIVLTCSLRWSDTQTFGGINTHQVVSQYTIDAANLYRANPRAYGFDAVADIMTPNSPFQCDYNVFASFNTLYYPAGDVDGLGPVRLHWSNLAQQYVAAIAAPVLLNVDGTYKPAGSSTNQLYHPAGYLAPGPYQPVGG